MEKTESELFLCKECGGQVGMIVKVFKVSILSLGTETGIEATEICLGCLQDLIEKRIFEDC